MNGKLKKVGFWEESSSRFLGFSTPNEPIPSRLREYMVAYFSNGEVLNPSWGFSNCKFGCGIPDPVMGDFERTDGTYIWPAGIVHYMLEHGVMPNKDLMSHALSRRSQIPPHLGNSHNSKKADSIKLTARHENLRLMLGIPVIGKVDLKAQNLNLFKKVEFIKQIARTCEYRFGLKTIFQLFFMSQVTIVIDSWQFMSIITHPALDSLVSAIYDLRFLED